MKADDRLGFIRARYRILGLKWTLVRFDSLQRPFAKDENTDPRTLLYWLSCCMG